MSEKDMLQQYVEDAVKTASRIDEVTVHYQFYTNAVKIFIEAAAILDQIKKNVFYNKPYNTEMLLDSIDKIDDAAGGVRNGTFYMHDSRVLGINPDVFHGILGIATESGELLELLKPGVEPNKIFDEVGDLNWYMALTIDALDGDWHKIQKANIAKLKARYPEKFDANRAICRDVNEEKRVLDDVLGQ